MATSRRRISPGRLAPVSTLYMSVRMTLTFLLLAALSMVLAACESGGSPASTPNSTPLAATSVPTVQGSAAATSVPAEDATSEVAPTSGESSGETGSTECDKLNEAQYTISGYLQRISAIKGDEDYQAAKVGTFKFTLDPSELRGAAATLAGMPDFVGERVSAQVPEFQQMVDLLESNLQSGKPFSDGSGNGQKLADLVDAEFVESLSALDDAIVKNKCRDY